MKNARNMRNTRNAKNIKNNAMSSRKSAVLILAGFLLLLTGCAGMNNQFDCNVDSGGKCVPMDQINKMASAGVFNR